MSDAFEVVEKKNAQKSSSSEGKKKTPSLPLCCRSCSSSSFSRSPASETPPLFPPPAVVSFSLVSAPRESARSSREQGAERARQSLIHPLSRRSLHPQHSIFPSSLFSFLSFHPTMAPPDLDEWIERLRKCEHLEEDELKTLCEMVS